MFYPSRIYAGDTPKPAMSQFSQDFFEKILAMEGGYQADPDDVGNYVCDKLIGTNRGISAIALREYLGRCPTVADSKGIDDSFAWYFYTWYFGKKSRYLEVEDQETAELLMNNHMGAPARAAEAAQRAMNHFGYGLEIDGIAGSKTIAAINDAVRQNKTVAYNAIRLKWLEYLKTTNAKFRDGLIARIENNFPALVLEPSEPGAYTDITSGGAGYQVQRAKSVFLGAIRGDEKDIAALGGIAAGIAILLIAIKNLSSKSAPSI